ncbi:MAG: pentapeptide repeat-containing protein [Cyclobacteriaceae bacterium]
MWEEEKLTPIKDEKEFADHIIGINQPIGEIVFSGLSISYLDFQYNFSLPFEDNKLWEKFLADLHPNQRALILLGKNQHQMILRNCRFSESFQLRKKVQSKLVIHNCKFVGEFKIPNISFEAKLKVRHCHFNRVNFYNTKFIELADFYSCHFHKRLIFLKTDFKETTVFSGSTFYENVLFTYTLIEKLIILRGTTFKKGLDLSTAILSGELNCFGIRLENFRSLKIEKKLNMFLSTDKRLGHYEMFYDNAITKVAKIPIENKIETYRIIKQRLISQNNSIASVPFNALEKSAHFWRKIYSLIPRVAIEKDVTIFSKNARNLCNWTNSIFEIILLFLNYISNGHGKSYSRGVLFTFGISAIFFNLSLIFTSNYEYTSHFNEWHWCLTWTEFDYFVQSILPIHNFDYLLQVDETGKSKFKLEKGYYAIDFLGRIFIGYGIYQTIQAFRKYK